MKDTNETTAPVTTTPAERVTLAALLEADKATRTCLPIRSGLRAGYDNGKFKY